MPAVPGHGGQVGTRACPHRPRDDPDRAPTRVRCRDCGATHILLPTALQVRRADTAEVIGNALAHKAKGLGFRRIAERMGRPESTVRRWLRRTTGEHVQWLHRRGTERLGLVAREAFCTIRYVGNPLGDALCVLSAAAVEDRRRFGFPDPPWDLIGIYTQGRLLSPPRSG
ncbi:helix-turn-helix domain-containing protein [Rhodococcus sp. 21391]|nr:helix-turn-helix domain-containing protein [Rhodococcus sp. 21391]